MAAAVASNVAAMLASRWRRCRHHGQPRGQYDDGVGMAFRSPTREIWRRRRCGVTIAHAGNMATASVHHVAVEQWHDVVATVSVTHVLICGRGGFDVSLINHALVRDRGEISTAFTSRVLVYDSGEVGMGLTNHALTCECGEIAILLARHVLAYERGGYATGLVTVTHSLSNAAKAA